MNKYDYVKKNVDDIRKEIFLLNNGVKLLGVTKFHPVEAIEAAIESGLSEFGESRVQEASEKIAYINEKHKGIKWHFIGHLQTNKAGKVVEDFNVIESCDSLKLAQKISECAVRNGITANCFLEIKVSTEKSKYGVVPDNVFEVLNGLQNLKNITIRGLMTMAPYSADRENSRPYFKITRKLFDDIKRTMTGGNMVMEELSMGMSDDYRTAIEEGSTLVRIGTKIFGSRV
jgi:PLP dependent protein